MSNHIADANKMVDETPRTDAAEKHAYQFKDDATPVCESKFARQLERELNAANAKIKRLEEALDTLTLVVGLTPIVGNKDALQEAMDMARAELKAKEDKP